MHTHAAESKTIHFSPDKRKDNLTYKPGPLEKVHDVRGAGNHFTLDQHGFEYIRHSTRVSDVNIYSKEHVENIYLPECEQLLKNVLDGADEVHVFDWRVMLRLSPAKCSN
jgi:hypothetical protein